MSQAYDVVWHVIIFTVAWRYADCITIARVPSARSC